jgi:hypothetical protein
MSLKKRLLTLILILLAASVVAGLLAPLVVSNGLLLWIWWEARAHGLKADVGKIEAPFLRPVTIHNIHITPLQTRDYDLDLSAPRITLDFNFRGRFLSKRTRFIRRIELPDLHGSIRKNHRFNRVPRPFDWKTFHELLPDNIQLTKLNLDVEIADAAFRLVDATVTASEIEAGRIFAREITISSVLLHQTFSGLRGATSWQEDRITFGGLSLAQGLDLESITADFTRLRKSQLRLELNLDAFGGKVRASVIGHARRKQFMWDAAGSASEISLAQISKALGFAEPINGALHASKFTFRGSSEHFFDATASFWTELSGFAWRDRKADTVMFGATLYNHHVQVEQLYVQQQKNQFTLTGDFMLPKETQAWKRSSFQGQISASIDSLGEFAQLFGATPADFSGQLSLNGALSVRNRNLAGELKLQGLGVALRGVPIESLNTKLTFHGSQVILENLEMRHAEDFLIGHGSYNFGPERRYSGRLTGAISDLGAYAPLTPASWQSSKITGGITLDWKGHGSRSANSGTILAAVHGLQTPTRFLRVPLNFIVDGTYSPQNLFFRKFQLSNERIALSAFVTLGNNYVQLQQLQWLVDGKSRVDGSAFVPFSMEKFRQSRDLIGALDEKQKFDVDLLFKDLDWSELSAALGEDLPVSGKLNGNLAAYGTLNSLQLTTKWHFQDFDFQTTGAPRGKNVFDLDLVYGNRIAAIKADALLSGSDTINVRANIPLLLDKKHLRQSWPIATDLPFSATLDFLAVSLEKLPQKIWPLQNSAGIVSGNLSFSSTFSHPEIFGDFQISAGAFDSSPRFPRLSNLSARIAFAGTKASIDALNFSIADLPVSLGGRFDFSEPKNWSLKLSPHAVVGIAISSQDACLRQVEVSRRLGHYEDDQFQLRDLIVRGGLNPASWICTFVEDKPARMSSAPEKFFALRLPQSQPEHEPRIQDTFFFSAPESVSGATVTLIIEDDRGSPTKAKGDASELKPAAQPR